MTFNELAVKLKTTVRNLPALVNVLSDAFADIESGSASINYSETEQDTGLKWIDGSAIYQKTIDLGTLPNAVGQAVNKAHNITNLGIVVSVMCVAYKSGSRICIPNTNANNYLALMNLNIMDDNVVVMTGGAMKDYHAYITLTYTKTA